MQIFKKAEDDGSGIPARLQHGPKEAAMLLGICERKLYDLIEDGRLKSYRLDGKRFVSRSTLKPVARGPTNIAATHIATKPFSAERMPRSQAMA